MITNLGTHITHCCFMHGCKYGNLECPVTRGKLAQRYPCEFCPDMQDDAQMRLAYLLNEMYDRGFAAAEKIADEEIDRAVKNAMSEVKTK